MARVQESISHSGKVLAVGPSEISVEIVSESACGSCHAASLCSVSQLSRKTVQVPRPASPAFEPGEEVDLLLKASMGHKAVWLAYVLPLAVLMAVLLGALQAGASEPAAGGAALAGVALYYLVIWLMRGRLRSEYVFAIGKKVNKP